MSEVLSVKKNHILALFDRPHEPLVLPKGPEKTIFKGPPSIQGATPFDDEKALIPSASNEEVQLVDVPLPDLTEITYLISQDINFSTFNENHMYAARKMIEWFLGSEDIEKLQSLAAYVRDKVNYSLFRYTFAVALLHRKDTKTLDLPLLVNNFPGKFIDGKVLDTARQYGRLLKPECRPTATALPETSSELEPEHKVAYFREDVGVNLHHYHWHEVYPASLSIEQVRKDRRGELFFYMHQQMIARYNFERISNGLNPVERFVNFFDHIPQAYFPKLDKSVVNRPYPGRPKNLSWGDIDRPHEGQVDISLMMMWRTRIMDAIHQGYLITKDGNRVNLGDNKGIDHLGNVIESSVLSIHPEFYGDLHNMGHVFTSTVHDPTYSNRELAGVMCDVATAVRDPMFFRWHSFINGMFVTHKNLLPIYTDEELNYPGIAVSGIEVIEEGGTRDNTLTTFLEDSVIDVQGGLDHKIDGPVLVAVTHLQHNNFTYKITVSNSHDQDKMGTCRIFLSPTINSRNVPWHSLTNQRHTFIEMDRFTCKLKPGVNQIERASHQSSIILPYERTFRDTNPSRSNATIMETSCTCGWPEHMLVPKGKHQGLQCQLFVMISNYDDDKVDPCDDDECNGNSFCGIKDKKYPDARPMGFPFDRNPKDKETLKDFMKERSNMALQNVNIVFIGKKITSENSEFVCNAN